MKFIIAFIICVQFFILIKGEALEIDVQHRINRIESKKEFIRIGNPNTKEEAPIYLAGDIGGTKSYLALYKEERGKLLCIKEQELSSQRYPDLKELLLDFLKESKLKISKACLAVPGPVKERKCQITNLPWFVDANQLESQLRIQSIILINDLLATAHGLDMLEEDEFYVMNKGDLSAKGNKAIIAAGTGLGESGIFYNERGCGFPFPTEGGHTDFAPRNKQEDSLLSYLRKKFDHVSYEKILSGPGLCNLYHYIIETGDIKEEEGVYKEIISGNIARAISEKATKGESEACLTTLKLFSSIYGAEAKNLALKTFATGGVYIGGGIAPKIIKVLSQGDFMQAFVQPGHSSSFLKEIPVRVILNDKAALLGALYYAKYVM